MLWGNHRTRPLMGPALYFTKTIAQRYGKAAAEDMGFLLLVKGEGIYLVEGTAKRLKGTANL